MLSVETQRHPEMGGQSVKESLESGDHLRAREFLRRYERHAEIKKAELIERIVYMSSPVSLMHSEPDGIIHGWLLVYSAHTPGTRFSPNTTVMLDADNVFQPDALLRLLPERGGKAQVTEEDYLEGPPELVVEIATSSVSIDLHKKLRVYRRAGVREYLVWRTVEKAFDWFLLQEEEYQPNVPDANGILHSRVFPGLDLHLQALLSMDAATVLATLQTGLASPGHAAFVGR